MISQLHSLIETDNSSGKDEHVLRCGWTGLEMFRCDAQPLGTSLYDQEVLPYIGMAPISIDGICQVVFKDITANSKRPVYHYANNVAITTRAMNMAHHRYPPHVHYLNLLLFALSHQYPDYTGQLDHLAHKVMVRISSIMRTMYASWCVPCGHVYRARMTLEAYVESRRMAEVAMRGLNMRFATTLPSIDSPETGIGGVDAATLASICERERGRVEEAGASVWLVRPGNRQRVSQEMRTAIRSRSEALHAEIKRVLNIDPQLNLSGIIGFAAEGRDTLDDVIEDVTSPIGNHPYVSKDEWYAHAICSFVQSVSHGKKLPTLTGFCMTSNHVRTVPFVVPYISKGSLSTSPSRRVEQV